MTSEVFNVDCMEYMRTLPDKAFDLAVVDPPYFSGPEKRGYYGQRVSKVGVRRDYPISPTWNIPSSEYFSELERVSKYYIIWGCNYYNFIFPPGRIVWDKCNDKSSFSNCEIAATNIHNSVRIFRFMWNGMLQGKSVAEGQVMQGNKRLNELRIHPTQKPIALYRWIFKIDKKYFDAQETRFEKYKWQKEQQLELNFYPHDDKDTPVMCRRRIVGKLHGLRRKG